MVQRTSCAVVAVVKPAALTTGFSNSTLVAAAHDSRHTRTIIAGTANKKERARTRTGPRKGSRRENDR